jgi:branched-chain amino acid transport system ATP-binding protein
MSALLQIKGLSKRFGGFVALDRIDLVVQPGERLGLIGPNGSGKSTLVNCVCGTLQNETGSVHFAGQALDGMAAHRRTHIGLARSFQLPRPFVSLSVMDNLRIPLLYTVRRRSLLISSPEELDDRSMPRRGACRATSRKSRCASWSSPAPWPPSRSC